MNKNGYEIKVNNKLKKVIKDLNIYRTFNYYIYSNRIDLIEKNLWK